VVVPVSRRVRRLHTFGIGCIVTVGVAHLLIMALSTVSRAPEGERHARQAMRAAPITMFGLSRNMNELFNGANAAMGLLAVGIGVLSLVAVRQAPHLLTGRRAVIWVDLGSVLVLLVVSILAFPPPPIVALAAAAVAFGLALAAPRESLDIPPVAAARTGTAPVDPQEVRHVAG
jgi:hypothetical protein